MKTTLNFPDDLISEAKIQAAIEHTTLTNIIIEGLKIRLKNETGGKLKVLPNSLQSFSTPPFTTAISSTTWSVLTHNSSFISEFILPPNYT